MAKKNHLRFFLPTPAYHLYVFLPPPPLTIPVLQRTSSYNIRDHSEWESMSFLSQVSKNLIIFSFMFRPIFRAGEPSSVFKLHVLSHYGSSPVEGTGGCPPYWQVHVNEVISLIQLRSCI